MRLGPTFQHEVAPGVPTCFGPRPQLSRMASGPRPPVVAARDHLVRIAAVARAVRAAAAPVLQQHLQARSSLNLGGRKMSVS
eukprot:13408401-Alexandrium_andersonii.AAC.1